MGALNFTEAPKKINMHDLLVTRPRHVTHQSKKNAGLVQSFESHEYPSITTTHYAHRVFFVIIVYFIGRTERNKTQKL